MSLFNWGGETPEQRAIRARLEQDALFEQAARLANARNSSQFGGAGGGGPQQAVPKNLYGIAFNGLIYKLDGTEEPWEYNYVTFPELTCAVLNPDDGFLYAVLEIGVDSYFIRIDRVTRDFTFIENNISDFSTKGASSLYYEGDGRFIYLDNCYKNAVSSIIRVTLTGPDTAIATEVAEVDSESTGYLLRNLFTYQGSVWAIAIDEANTPYIGPFNLATGDFYYSEQILINPSNPAIDQLVGVLGTAEHNGTLYSVIAYEDPENNGSIGLFTIDLANTYHATFVRQAFIESAENTIVYSLVSF